MEGSKVVVIGLDALTPDLVELWMEEGKLPNLARLRREGAYGHLRSTIPPSSPQAWSSFLTGKNPGKHGIYGFAQRRPDSYTWALTTAQHRRGPDLGQIISAYGKRSGFLLVPLTYPPYPLDGFIVSGMGTPGPKAAFTHPKELKDELLKEFGVEALFEPPIVDQKPDDYFSQLEESVEQNCQVFRCLQKKFPNLDYYMAVIVAPDRIQHVAWHFMDPTSPKYVPGATVELRDAILRVYQKADNAVGEIAATLDPDVTLIVMSDHGAGSYKKFVDLNAWLAQQGFLNYAEKATEHSERFVSRVYHLWRKWPRQLFSPWSRRQLKTWLPQTLRKQVDAEWQNSHFTYVDWSRTMAFSEGTDGLITLNIRGREPEGIIPPDEREAVLSRVEHGLYELKDPETGESVVNRVWRREEIYDGEMTKKAPDLVVEWLDEQYHSRALWNREGVVFLDLEKWKTTEMVLSGHHRSDGVIFASGPFVAPGTAIVSAAIIDLAPTILALMNIPLLPDFDGRVLKELTVGLEGIKVSQPGTLSDQTGHSDVYTDEEAKQVENLLRGLGYIE